MGQAAIVAAPTKYHATLAIAINGEFDIDVPATVTDAFRTGYYAGYVDAERQGLQDGREARGRLTPFSFDGGQITTFAFDGPVSGAWLVDGRLFGMVAGHHQPETLAEEDACERGYKAGEGDGYAEGYQEGYAQSDASVTEWEPVSAKHDEVRGAIPVDSQPCAGVP
jgi:hypothetical protein